MAELDKEWMCGIVVRCDSYTLELLHEGQVYRTPRVAALVSANKADWVAFKVDENDNVVETKKFRSRRWGSREELDGSITVIIHAVIRDYDDYPQREPFPNQPWSWELDYLEDPQSLMTRRRGVRPDFMHVVKVKIVEHPDDQFTFRLMEVFHETLDEDMLLKFFYAPWVVERLQEMEIIKDTEPIRERSVGKVHSSHRFHGIVARKFPDGGNVWSEETGMLRVETETLANVAVGDYVLFKVKKFKDHHKALQVKQTTGRPHPTKTVARNPFVTECAVRVLLPVPESVVGEETVVTNDIFLGKVEIPVRKLESALLEMGTSLSDVQGRQLWIWVAPIGPNSPDYSLNHFWILHEIEKLSD